MAGEVVNSSFVLLSKFGASRQESASKTATSHIRKTLCVILTVRENITQLKNNLEKQVHNIVNDYICVKLSRQFNYVNTIRHRKSFLIW
jgi:hypothetical protein